MLRPLPCRSLSQPGPLAQQAQPGAVTPLLRETSKSPITAFSFSEKLNQLWRFSAHSVQR